MNRLTHNEKGNCVQSAQNLKKQRNGQGEVYWVATDPDSGQSIGHAYYLSPKGEVLNLEDQGYNGYPRFSTEVIKSIGTRL